VKLSWLPLQAFIILLVGAQQPAGSPALLEHGRYLTDEQELQILTTGKAADRPAPLPPMPLFRMTPEDARAVIAYLRSL